jgi:uncharacterized protein YijF (DUF1287 family)
MYYKILHEKINADQAKRMKATKKNSVRVMGTSSLLMACMFIFVLYNQPDTYSQKVYTAKELGIMEVTSSVDKDSDGIDDYTDIMLGAREYIESNPEYKSKYYDGGYPNDGYGVCTDVIWNAFQAAGYNLRDMVDADVAKSKENYTTIETPDSNIDFRRVNNLYDFFERNAKVLSTNLSNPEDWQAGDIVVFTKHIAICSDKRNEKGIPFLIHFDSKGAREVNEIEKYKIVGHYRWVSN